jgi:predicted ATP-dependent serine protease
MHLQTHEAKDHVHKRWIGKCRDHSNQSSIMEERELEAGTSSTSKRRKGKQPIVRSPHKHLNSSIVLPRILEGVQATPSLLGCIERLQYTDRDVSDTIKFLEFA